MHPQRNDGLATEQVADAIRGLASQLVATSEAAVPEHARSAA